MTNIVEFDTVRVVALQNSPESHLAISQFDRPPAIGDLGTVVGYTSPYDPQHPATRFIVESCATDGRTIWLAEFSHDEIEFVKHATWTSS